MLVNFAGIRVLSMHRGIRTVTGDEVVLLALVNTPNVRDRD
jgi:hypothetical protein